MAGGWQSVRGFDIVRQVQITVKLEHADVDALSDLREWLLEAEAVRRYAKLRWAGVAGPDATGVGLDALQLVVGSGYSVRQLVHAIGEWQDSVESGPTVFLSLPARDGAVGVTVLDPDSLEAAIRALEAG